MCKISLIIYKQFMNVFTSATSCSNLQNVFLLLLFSLTKNLKSFKLKNVFLIYKEMMKIILIAEKCSPQCSIQYHYMHACTQLDVGVCVIHKQPQTSCKSVNLHYYFFPLGIIFSFNWHQIKLRKRFFDD